MAVTHAPLSHGPPFCLLLATFEQTTWAKFHIQKIFFFFIFCCAFICCNFRGSKLNNKQNEYWGERESIEVTFGAPHALSLSLSLAVWHCDLLSSRVALNATAAVAAATVSRHITRWTFASASAFICLLRMQKESDDRKKSTFNSWNWWLAVCLSVSLSLSLCLETVKLTQEISINFLALIAWIASEAGARGVWVTALN